MTLPIDTDRLTLRVFTAGDAPGLHALFADPHAMRYVGRGPLAELEETEAVLRGYIHHQLRHGFSFWALIDGDSGRLAGDAGLFRVDGEVQLGYTLGPEWWGRGYATEAGRACMGAAFGALELDAVTAVVDPHNAASMKVLDKLGFRSCGSRLAYGRRHLVYRRSRDAV